MQSLLTASIEIATIASIAYFSLMFVIGFATRSQSVALPKATEDAVELTEDAVEPASYAAATIAPAAVLVIEDEAEDEAEDEPIATVAPMTRREALAIAKERKIPKYSRMDTATLREAVAQVLNA